MVSAATAIGTSASPAGTKAFSFWVNGLDLERYLDWRSIDIEMRAGLGDTSRARFRLENFDGSLDFGDFWGTEAYIGVTTPAAYPLMEVMLHRHTSDEPLFGGYISGMRTTISGAVLSSIELDCVGYSLALDAAQAQYEFVIPDFTNLAAATMIIVGNIGLRGGVQARRGTFGSDGGDPGVSSIGSTNDGAILVAIGTTIRQALGQWAAASLDAIGAYVDNYKRLCVVPENVYDATGVPSSDFGAGATTIGAQSLEMVADFAEYATRIYIDGANPEGSGTVAGAMITGAGASSISTYWPHIDIDGSIANANSDNLDNLDQYGQAALSDRHRGLFGFWRLRTGGTFGWRLLMATLLYYDQLRATNTPTGVVIGYRLSFESPTYPIFDLDLASSFQWGTGGDGSAVTGSATSAEYLTRRLARR